MSALDVPFTLPTTSLYSTSEGSTIPTQGGGKYDSD